MKSKQRTQQTVAVAHTQSSIETIHPIRVHTLYAQHSFIILNQKYRHTYETIARPNTNIVRCCCLHFWTMLIDIICATCFHRITGPVRDFGKFFCFSLFGIVIELNTQRHTTFGIVCSKWLVLSFHRNKNKYYISYVWMYIIIFFFFLFFRFCESFAMRWPTKCVRWRHRHLAPFQRKNNSISPTLNYVALILISFLLSSAHFISNASIACAKCLFGRKERKKPSKK